jgi:hypothetical protein
MTGRNIQAEKFSVERRKGTKKTNFQHPTLNVQRPGLVSGILLLALRIQPGQILLPGRFDSILTRDYVACSTLIGFGFHDHEQYAVQMLNLPEVA